MICLFFILVSCHFYVNYNYNNVKWFKIYIFLCIKMMIFLVMENIQLYQDPSKQDNQNK